jgi:hypothetical protein
MTRVVPLFTVALGVLLTFASGAELRAQSLGLYVLGVQYGTAAPSDPLAAETKLDIFFPVGGYPKIWGLNTPVMPVAVLVHGGNTNAPSANPPQLSTLPLALLEAGFVVVIPSYHVLDLDASEEFVNATKDVGRVVQFLRRFHAIINIDPSKVFVQGHSGGGFHALFLGLNVDLQDLASPDPTLKQSSRPDFVVPWGSPTDWACFDFNNAANNYFAKYFFGEIHPSNITAQEKQEKAPTYWLAHPELFGRTTTPPMCLAYNLGIQSPCGAIIDVHDGMMGILLKNGIDALCLRGAAGQSLCTESVLLSTWHGQGIPSIVAWMSAQAF